MAAPSGPEIVLLTDEEYRILGGSLVALRLTPGGELRIPNGALVLGGDSARTNASVGLEIKGTTLALLLSGLTVAQRNALTPANGMILYGSDAPAGLDVRINGAWRRIPDTATSFKEVEIDLGATPVRDALVNTVDAAVTTGSIIMFNLSGKAPTGKDTDDVWMDNIVLQAEPKAGSIDWRIRDSADEHIAGAFKINYVVV